MKRAFFITIFIASYQIFFIGNALAWVKSQPTINGSFTVNLKCSSPFFVGRFQDCHVDILGLKHFRTGKKLKNISIILDGGMPKHAHGLPTAPEIIWSNQQSTYQINGLKFSMPGEWQLRFYIEDKNYQLKDMVTFNFTI